MTKDSEAPKPDSPVCVEVKGLEWQDCTKDDPFTMIARTPFGNYSVGQGDTGCVAVLDWPSMWDWWPDAAKGEQDTLEAAQAACQADFTRRTLELVNARSVESVRAERDRELEPVFAALKKHHDQALSVGSVIFPAEPDMPEPVEIDLSEAYADSSIYEETVAALALRSLTEGEG